MAVAVGWCDGWVVVGVVVVRTKAEKQGEDEEVRDLEEPGRPGEFGEILRGEGVLACSCKVCCE